MPWGIVLLQLRLYMSKTCVSDISPGDKHSKLIALDKHSMRGLKHILSYVASTLCVGSRCSCSWCLSCRVARGEGNDSTWICFNRALLTDHREVSKAWRNGFSCLYATKTSEHQKTNINQNNKKSLLWADTWKLTKLSNSCRVNKHRRGQSLWTFVPKAWQRLSTLPQVFPFQIQPS